MAMNLCSFLDMVKKVIDVIKQIPKSLKLKIKIDIDIGINDNSNSENATLSETTTVSDIKKVWPVIDQDIRVDSGSSGCLWLHVGKKGDKKFIDIGVYYSCKVKEKEKIFWIGAEANDAGENRVYLFINTEQVNRERQEPRYVCDVLPDENRVYVIPVDEFSSDVSQKEIEVALNKKLKIFLEDIFNDN